jgi:hypothetical protein
MEQREQVAEKGSPVVPSADDIVLERPMRVVLAGKAYSIEPPKVIEVRRFRAVLMPLDAAVAAAMKALKEDPDNPEKLMAVHETQDALTDAVLCAVPSIKQDYDRILNTGTATIQDELREAFENIYWWYLDPLARRLADAQQRRRRALMTKMDTSKDVSSPTS